MRRGARGAGGFGAIGEALLALLALQGCGGSSPPGPPGPTPQLTLTGGAIHAVQSLPFDGSLGILTDSDTTDSASAFTVAIDWGDGTTSAGTAGAAAGAAGFEVRGQHTYAASGHFTIQLTVAHSNGVMATGTTEADVDPQLNLVGVSSLQPIQGVPFESQVAYLQDANPIETAADIAVSIDWGDGTTSAGTAVPDAPTTSALLNFAIRGAHTFNRSGPYSVTVRVVSTRTGAVATNTFSGSVAEQLAISIAGGFTATAIQGVPLDGEVAYLVDASPTDTAADLAVTIDWGDGTTSAGAAVLDQGHTSRNFLIKGPHTYNTTGTYTIHVNVVATISGASVTTTALVSVTRQLDYYVTSSLTVFQDVPFDRQLIHVIDRNPTDAASDLAVTIDWGDGTTSAGEPVLDAAVIGEFLISGSHTYHAAGSYTIHVVVTALKSGATISADTSARVLPPLSATGVNITAVQRLPFTGTVANLTASNASASASTFTARIDWGDGITTTAGTLAGTSGSFQVAGSHTYASTGVFTMTVSIANPITGDSAVATSTATVKPELAATAHNLFAIQGVPSIPLVAVVAEADAAADASTLSAEIDWGDGTIGDGVVTGGGGALEVSGLHVYRTTGTFVVAVSVSRLVTGAHASATSTATVDPAATTSGDATCVIQDDGSLDCWGDNSDGEAMPPAGSFNALTMTWNHGCALAGDGSVTCWGRDPSTPPAGAFVQVATGAAAAAHSCGLRPSGAVECWGDDNFQGSDPPAGTFIQVTAGDGHGCAMRPDDSITCWGYLRQVYLPANGAPTGTFRVLGEGALHACGLRMDGTIACWGNNDYGQTAAPSGHFVGLSVAELTTCALKDDGSIVCWGYNMYGQSTPPSGTFRSLVPSAGYDQCAYRADGALVCWGLNASGQATPPGGTFLGIAGEYSRYCRILPDRSASCFGQPNGVIAVPAAGPFTALTGGAYHTCGLRVDGTVACWGDNGNMQSTPPSGTFTEVSAGWAHTCGIRTDGTAACWGYNVFGQSTPPAGTFTDVAAGGYHTCGIRSDGSVTCWGQSSEGELLVPSGTFTKLSGGMRHTCGIRASDGSVACWGDNAAGQTAALPGAFSSIAAGEIFTCGIRTDHTLACWGDDTYGVATPPPGTYGTLATRRSFACALRLDGTEACWGGTVR